MLILPAHVHFLAYPDCIQIDFGKSEQLLLLLLLSWNVILVNQIQSTFGSGLKCYLMCLNLDTTHVKFHSIFSASCNATHNSDVKSRETEEHARCWADSRLLQGEDNTENNSLCSHAKHVIISSFWSHYIHAYIILTPTILRQKPTHTCCCQFRSDHLQILLWRLHLSDLYWET